MCACVREIYKPKQSKKNNNFSVDLLPFISHNHHLNDSGESEKKKNPHEVKYKGIVRNRTRKKG